MQEKVDKNIKEKLEYIGLDLNNIPKNLKEFKPLDFRVSKSYDETKHRQYRYLPVKDIQIMLSPTNRLEELEQKYKKASPIYSYLVPESEEDIIKHTTFLSMLEKVKIEEIEEIEKEQKELNKKIPFKVKYTGNYLWQIYYSANTDQYFMIVPTDDSNYSAFFYLLKKQLEKRKTGKIFVPINHIDYSRKYLKKSEFEDIEKYLWLFTKDWPFIYEVYDKNENMTIHIIGETFVYGNIKSPYKIILENKEEANKFYKLLKALFILQTELPKYFEFSTSIDKQGKIMFNYKEKEIKYEELSIFLKEQYAFVQELQKVSEANILNLKEKLNKLKELSIELEAEYLTKERQISTFLECKKTFFGKVKYYFKYSKKSNKNKSLKQFNNIVEEDVIEQNLQEIAKKNLNNKTVKKNHTLDEVIKEYKNYEIQENEIKNKISDIRALTLKNKNMKKKIENATQYIQEIENHKKSIFEFWKYSNKDEVSTLTQGEEEEIGIEHKIVRPFNYKEDKEKLGIKWDKWQRKNITKDELDAIYISSTDILPVLNKVKLAEIDPKEIEKNLKKLKEQAKNEKSLWDKEDFDIFGGMLEDSTKIKQIKDKKHREIPKDKFNILDITKTTKQLGYKLTLEKIVENIKKALEKSVIDENIILYKATEENKLNKNELYRFNINPEEEINEILNTDKNKINLYCFNLKSKIQAIPYTNIVFYDNKNETLPLGMDLSNKILLSIENLELINTKKDMFRIIELEKNDFAKAVIKTVQVFCYEVKDKK